MLIIMYNILNKYLRGTTMKKKLFAFGIVLSLIFSLSIAYANDTVKKFDKISTYKDNFSDVKTSDWYYDGVKTVFETGLMTGVSNTIFDTESTLTVAQGITIASRINSIYFGRDILDVSDGKKWYDKYIHYALDNAIILEDSFDNYDRPLKSYEMVTILYNALPSEYFETINNILSIPDINSSLPYYSQVLTFYNAGILNGNDKYGTFLPESSITRKRAAVIISRITNKALRLSFELTPLCDYTLSDMQNIINSICLKSTSDDIAVMYINSNAVSLSDLRFVYTSAKGTVSQDSLKETVINTLRENMAVSDLCKNSNMVITPAEYNSFLSSYYILRYTFGENYKSLLDTIGATDKAYLNTQLLYSFYSKYINDNYNIGAPLSPTYQEIYDFAIKNEYICAKNLFIDPATENAKSLAEELLEKAISGEDFDTLIKTYGQDPGTTTNPDGYIFTKGEMVKEFEDAAYSLSDGEISGIVETSYGYHIIKRMPIPNNKPLDSETYTQLFAMCTQNKALTDLSLKISDQKVTQLEAFDEIFEML